MDREVDRGRGAATSGPLRWRWPGPPPAYFARCELARRAFARGDYAGAERYLKSFSAGEYYPSPTLVALWLGKTYEGMGDRKRAFTPRALRFEA